MPLEFIGNQKPIPRKRWITGIYEMDRAFHMDGETLGIPIETAWEFTGAKGIGKSTLAHSLALMLSKHLSGSYVWAETEGDGFDVAHLEKIAEAFDFDMPIGKAFGEHHAELMEHAFELLTDNSTNCRTLLWDSVAAIVPIAEINNRFGEESDRGRRAKLINQIARRAMNYTMTTSDQPRTFILVNHKKMKQNLRNPRYPEYYFPGGIDKEYLCRVHLDFTRSQKKYTAYKEPLGQIVNVKILKNSFGGNEKKSFPLWIRSGYGLSPGMTNIHSAIELGILQNSKGVLKHKEDSLGRIYDWYTKPEDHDFSIIDDLLEKNIEDSELKN